MTRKTPERNRPRRLGRLRSVAVLAATALAAPVGLAAVTASPASAAPVTLRVTGDPASVNDGLWVWGGDHYSELRNLLATTTFGEATFQVDAAGKSPTALTSADNVFVGGAKPGGYSPQEIAALNAWIANGGVYIALANHQELYDITSFLPGGGATLKNPPAQWEETSQPTPPVDPPVPNTHTCQMVRPVGDCFGINDYLRDHSAPAAAVVQNAGNATVARLVNGPHGSVNSANPIRNWHTVSVLNTIPNGAVEVAHLTATCDPVASGGSVCSGTSGFAYDNNIDGIEVAVVPFGTPGYGKGAALLSGDGDLFSNAYGLMTTGNRRLALNTFQWIGDHFAALANPPAPQADPSGFTPMTPNRIYDTRNGIGTSPGKVAGNSDRQVVVAGGSTGVPANATAVALNVTATNQDGAGFLTVYPTGVPKTTTSNVNIPSDPKDIANAVVVQVGAGGSVIVHNENNPTDVIVDVVGYWAPGGSLLNATAKPERILDTRNGIGSAGAIGEKETRAVQVTGLAGVPAGATGVVLNVTATEGTTGGFLTVHDTPTAPEASNVNFLANTNVPNLVFAKLDSTGRVNITNAIGSTQVIADVMGYFTASGSAITPVTPGRILDTRQTTKVGKNGVVSVGSIPAGATAVLVNVTVNEPEAGGFLTAFPSGDVPTASNVNFAPGQTVPNLVLARVEGGQFQIANTSEGASHVLVDIFAWF